MNWLNFLLFNCTIDENQDHKSLLALVFSQLPGEVKSLLTDQYDWAIARGYLVKAVRAILWGRMELGHEYFSKASKQRADIDITFIQALIYQLISYEKEFGPEASQERLQKMVPYMINLGGHQKLRLLKANYYFNQAINHFQARNRKDAVSKALHTLRNDPTFITNRGLISILLHSLIGLALDE